MQIKSGRHFKYNLSILFILLFHTILAQTTIAGKIIDKNNIPIPYVHIKIENTSIGTVSNENGLFKLVFSKNLVKRAIILSSLGYRTKKMNLAGSSNIIVLNPDITQLQEITIVSKDPARALINNAINSISKNYPLVDERHFGFFREITQWKKQPKPIYIAETSMESIKKEYSTKHTTGDVKLVEYRKYKSRQLDTLNMRIYAGVHHIHRFDVVARREAFLQKPGKFVYKIVDTLTKQNKSVYKIHFKSRDKLSGHVYILDSTYAIVKAEFRQASGFNNLLPSQNKRQFLNYTVSYEQSGDNIWRFKYSKYKTAFKRKKDTLILTSEYVTTNTEPNNHEITYLDRLQYTDILLNEEKVYKPDFWNNHNIILPNKEYESLFKLTDNISKERSRIKSKKWLNLLLKTKQEIGLSWSRIDVFSNNISFDTPALNIQENLTASNQNVYGLIFSLLYKLKPNFHVGYLSESKISKNGITSHNVSLQRQININLKSRPVFITPGINFGYQQLDFFLGNFTATEKLNVNNKSLKAGKTSVFLSQRNFRFQPNLSLSIEKSRRFSFTISCNYNIPVSKRNGLLFQEKKGFSLFRKKAFVKNGNENLAISNTSESLENKFGIHVGISLQL